MAPKPRFNLRVRKPPHIIPLILKFLDNEGFPETADSVRRNFKNEENPQETLEVLVEEWYLQQPAPLPSPLMPQQPPSNLHWLGLPNPGRKQVLRLQYLNSGTAVLALLSKGSHPVWRWPGIQATCRIPANLIDSMSMRINNRGAKLGAEVSSLALSGDGSRLASATGGLMGWFNTRNLKSVAASWYAPTNVSSLTLIDNNIIVIGRNDTKIEVYDVDADYKRRKGLKAHLGRVTGLALSKKLDMLVSSGADAQIVVWSKDGWKKKMGTFLEIPVDRDVASTSKTEVQFHPDETHLLAVHETQLAIFDATTLRKNLQWTVDKCSPPIHQATFSCDGRLIYSTSLDGSIYVLSDQLLVLCRIEADSYISSFESSKPYRCTLAIAAHPLKSNQIAVGLPDGEVYILEPPNGQWDGH